MKLAERVALVYGVSVLGAAAISYLRGREWSDVLFDAAVHGAIAGTGLNIVGYIVLGSGEEAQLVPVLQNPEFAGMGNVSPKGVKILETLDTTTLYEPLKLEGVKIAPIPEDPNMVLQDAD